MSNSETQTARSVPAWLVPALVAIGFLPLLFWHIGGLLERPHYQFVLLLPVALWLLSSGLESIPSAPVTRHEAVTGLCVLITAFLGLCFATWAWSPWIASVSAMIAVLGAMLATGGYRRVRRWLPVWIFSWIIVPLPFGMDEDLIVRLRSVTTRISSSVLDQLEVLHTSYANVIELPGKPLFIADACSGIHSLYVLMAAALFLSMWLHRGVLHTICLLVSTFALVLIENVARIVIVAVAWGSQMDFSIGWKHEALGIVLFCLSLFFVFTTDQLLMFLLPSRIPSLLQWTYEWLIGESEEQRKQKRSTPAPAGAVLQKAALAIAVLFPIAGVAQLARLPDTVPQFTDNVGDIELPQLTAEAFPAQLAGFVRHDYKTVARVPGDPLGQASQQWFFRRGPVSAMVSIDYPYGGIHDLCVCYSQTGWKIEDKRVVTEAELQQIDPTVRGGIAVGRLSRNLYGHGLLLFQLCDTKGNSDAVIKELARGDSAARAAQRLQAFGQPDKDLYSGGLSGPPYLQIQVLARSAEPFSDQQIKELLQLFLEARKIIHPVLMQHVSDSPENSPENKGAES